MVTQRLETHLPNPATLLSGATLPFFGFLPSPSPFSSHFPLADSPLHPLFAATTIMCLCASQRALLPPAQHHPCIPQGTWARVPKVGKRHTETNQLAAGSPRRERKASQYPFLPKSKKFVIPITHFAREVEGNRWEIRLPSIPRMSEPSLLNFFGLLNILLSYKIS